MNDRRASDRDRASGGRSVGRRTLLGATGSLVLAALAGCTTTEKPEGTLIEGGDAGDGDAGTETTPEPGTPTPKTIFSFLDSSFEPDDDGYMTYAATVENATDERWAATMHARLELDDPVTPEADDASATPTSLTPRDIDLTREIDLAPDETRDVTVTFDVTETEYFELYRSISFGISWSDLTRP